MEVLKKALKYVSLLAILIALSASDPAVKKVLSLTPFNGSEESQMTPYRLPNHTIPRMYNIYINPDMVSDDFTWIGKVGINIEVLYPTSTLTLHAYHNLDIYKYFTRLADANGVKLTPIKQSRDVEQEFFTIKFNRRIMKGNYSLSLKFRGTETWRLFGLFRYRSSNNSIIIGTNLSPTSARRAFPCWDEPTFKANFRVSIKHSSNFTAISNMPDIEKLHTPDGQTLTTFGTTPLMSAYNLKFVISQHHNYFNDYKNVSVHVFDMAADKIQHVLDLSPKVVKVMESYTGLSFGYPRIGSVLMPVFLSGGVEHWDLMPYDQSLTNGNQSMVTSAEKDKADLLIAHELSHTWFGNQVTPLWWNDIWLSEAFVTYFQYYIMDKINDNWHGMELFVVSNNQEASFPVDNDESNPVIWTPITNIEIRLMFQPITYRKGAAILHMFRNVLGDDIFREGIQKFMAKHSFSTAVTKDLTMEFQEAYDKGLNKDEYLNVTATMMSWLEQRGYPIVNVTRNYATGETVVSQKSTLLFENGSTRWWIPLTIATQSNANFSSTLPADWITDNEDFVTINGINKNDWIIINVQASGYYRVTYDDTNWNRLVKYLNSDNYKNIHVLNRAQLINDAFYLAHHEPERYYSIFYNLIMYLSREVEYLPWRSAYSAIVNILASLPRSSDEYNLFQHSILTLMEDFIKKVGFEVLDTDDHLTKLSRADVVHWACIAGHVDCANFAAKKILEFANDPVKNPLHPDIKGWIFCAGLRGLNATAAEMFAIWAYENEKLLLLEQVGCTDNHVIHKNLLDKTRTKVNDGNPFEMNIMMETLLTSTEENFNYIVDYFMESHRAMNTPAIMDRWWYELPVLLSRIVDEVKTGDRLEKLEKIMLLDVIIEDQYLDREGLIKRARKNVNEGDTSCNKFRKYWDQKIFMATTYYSYTHVK